MPIIILLIFLNNFLVLNWYGICVLYLINSICSMYINLVFLRCKDITQLRLNDLTAVDLLERCARFHIYCSHRLCEEDVAVFDEKINNKNLTNCLQSLKELYDDLWTNHGIQSPNEAEFRAYVVLMNLNEGEILRFFLIEVLSVIKCVSARFIMSKKY